jgi:HEAT repeat protein
MNNSYVFALAIALAAAPAAAQPVPVHPVPERPIPVAPVPVQPLPSIEPLKSLTNESFLFEAKALAEQGKLLANEAKLLTAEPFLHDAKALAEHGKIMEDHAKLIMTSPIINEAKWIAGHFAWESGQDRGRDREAELKEREREREAEMYSQGFNAASEARYERAVGYFDRVIELRGAKLDAALYWKAYSQNRLGQRSEALATIAELSKNHPNSTYRKQANVLEAEVRRNLGQQGKPQDSADDEVKLLALQALQNAAPEEAIPMIEKVLEGTSSPRVKQRALFVLAQSKAPRAREVLRNYAKGSSTPELQMQAIHYLGIHGGLEARTILQEVYGASTDVDVKRRILRSFMEAGDKDRLFKAAQGEQNATLRAEAVNQLGNMGAHTELWDLYQKESSVDVKRRIINALRNGGALDRLIQLAKAEQNPELRLSAVRTLGQMGSSRTSDVLVQIYASDTNVDVKKSVIRALGDQDNAAALVALARKEQDTDLKKEIVSRLSHMRSKVATDYMMELLGK